MNRFCLSKVQGVWLHVDVLGLVCAFAIRMSSAGGFTTRDTINQGSGSSGTPAVNGLWLAAPCIIARW